MSLVRVGLALLLILPAAGRAGISHLPPPARALLQQGAFQIIEWKQLPARVLALCADSDGRLAAPGQDWEPTDVILDPDLPRARLIWAARHGRDYLVHYERGGYAHSFHVLLVRPGEGDRTKVIWHAVGDKYKDLGALAAAVKANELDDDPTYTY